MFSEKRNNFIQPGEYRFYSSKRNNTLALIWVFFVLAWNGIIFCITPLNLFLREPAMKALDMLWHSPNWPILFFLLLAILFTSLIPFILYSLIFKKPYLIISPAFLQVLNRKYHWHEIVAVEKAFLGYSRYAASVPQSPILVIETTLPEWHPYAHFLLRTALKDQLVSVNPRNCFIVFMQSFTYKDRQKILSLIQNHIEIQKSALLLEAKKAGLPNSELREMGDFDDDDFV